VIILAKSFLFKEPLTMTLRNSFHVFLPILHRSCFSSRFIYLFLFAFYLSSQHKAGHVNKDLVVLLNLQLNLVMFILK